MLLTLFSATILAGALAGSAMAPDAGCALPSEPRGIPAALDAAITGPADKDRACMKALLVPEARMMFVSLGADGEPSYRLETLDDWIARVKARGHALLEEKQLKFHIERYGNIAHLWSTYALHSDGKQVARGINSIQAIKEAGGWRVTSIMVQAESATAPLGRSVPQHSITIRYKLAIAKFDVTRDEYAQFVAATNRPDPDSCVTVNASGTGFIATNGNWHSPGFPQTGRDPVVCVSWDDAQAYVAWLSVKTGHVYRLPTEAEWEYAARAGTTTARYHSDNPAELCRYSNVGDLDYSEQHPGDSGVNRACRDGYAFTSPVGSFPPNPFGLYDMLGNVMEWNEDCWSANYNGAPTDGTAWQSGDCGRRVVRGGSWDADLSVVRSANRRGIPTSMRHTTFGFRVARTL